VRVLLTVQSFSQAYGGPAFSVSGLARELVKHQISVTLWAPDGSAPKSPLTLSIAENLGSQNLELMEGSIDNSFNIPPDIIHDNGLWQPFHHQIANTARRLEIPRILSLRGMLEPWAYKQKHWRKRIAMALYQRRDITNAQLIHATSDTEARNFKLHEIKTSVCIVSNGVQIPSTDRSSAKVGYDSKSILFMSRLNPKKGLPLLLKALSLVNSNDWKLVIAGPDESGYRSMIEKLVDSYQLSRQVTIVGPVYGADKKRFYDEADLFVLPSYSENFGLAVAEALANSVPVLTTTGTPWSQLRSRECGWWVPATASAIAAGLQEALSLPRERLCQMGTNGRNLVREKYDWKTIGPSWLRIYESLRLRCQK